jgi:hypothetical protein
MIGDERQLTVLGTNGEIALRIFCALLSRDDAKLTPYPDLGEKEVRTSMMLAETFSMAFQSATATTAVRPAPIRSAGTNDTPQDRYRRGVQPQRQDVSPWAEHLLRRQDS